MDVHSEKMVRDFLQSGNEDIGNVASDMRQGFYYHLNQLRMLITDLRIKAGAGDVESLLAWCDALYELYTLTAAFIHDKKMHEYFEALAKIEDEIVKLRDAQKSMKSHDEQLRWQASNTYIRNYSNIQRKLHDRQKFLYMHITRRKLVVPLDDSVDPFEKWAEEAGADEDE